jgi:hypothetical protein
MITMIMIIILISFSGAFQRNSNLVMIEKPILGSTSSTHNTRSETENSVIPVLSNQLQVATGLKSITCLSVSFGKRC